MANSAATQDRDVFLSIMLATWEDRFQVEAVAEVAVGDSLEEHPVFIRVDNRPEAEFDNRHVYEDLERSLDSQGIPELNPLFNLEDNNLWEEVYFRGNDAAGEQLARDFWESILEAANLAYGGGRIQCINCASSGSFFNPGGCSNCGWMAPLPGR